VPISTSELEQLYCQCSQQLFICALAITGSPPGAEDVVHEAFCRMLRSKTHPGDLKAYAFRAVRNAAIDFVRRRGANETLPDFIFDPHPQSEMLAEDAEFLEQISVLFRELSTDERETIVAHLYGELTFQEISVIRGVPLGTVTSWYRRGLEKLRRKLEVADGSV
jgi:RNA polymerase sigma factor (sigma-70 family)